jgi:hypothetical protein
MRSGFSAPRQWSGECMGNTTEIETALSFLMSDDLKSSIAKDNVIRHLVKARNLLANAGLEGYSEEVNDLIKKAHLEEIEVEL